MKIDPRRKVYRTRDAAGRVRFYSRMVMGKLSVPCSYDDAQEACSFNNCRTVDVRKGDDGLYHRVY